MDVDRLTFTRALLAEHPLSEPRSALALCGRSAGEGRDMGGPIMDANDAALRLLDQMAADMRAMRSDVAAVQQAVSETKGLNLDSRLHDLSGKVEALAVRVSAVERTQDVERAQRKPWVYLLGELAKLIAAAAIGAGALQIFPHHPPH